jgi:hypothetical protein
MYASCAADVRASCCLACFLVLLAAFLRPDFAAGQEVVVVEEGEEVEVVDGTPCT